jgi:two-component system sensor histidine kinase UhpB
VDAAEVTLAHHQGSLTLTISDRGRGLPPGGAARTGIRGMRERANLIGARLEVHNLESEPGCEVRLSIPLEVSR